MGCRGGGRGGPDWQGVRTPWRSATARRDPRTMYNGNASFSLDNSVWDARTFSVTGAAVNKPAYANGRGSIMFGGPLADSQTGERQQAHHVHVRLSGAAQSHGRDLRSGQHADRIGTHRRFFAEHGARRGSDHLRSYDRLAISRQQDSGEPDQRRIDRAAAVFSESQSAVSPTRNYQTSWSGQNNSQNINSRVSNIKIGNKDTINAGVGYQGSSSISPNLFQFIDSGAGRGINANLAWSRAITARVINNLRYTFSRSRQLSSPYFADRENVAAELGIAGTSQNAANWGPPNLSFTNYAGLSDGNYSLNRNQTSALGESLTWVRGVHNLSFGGDYRRQQNNQLADNNGRGTYTFNGSMTSLPGERRGAVRHGIRPCRLPSGLTRHQFHTVRQSRQVFPQLGLRCLRQRRLADLAEIQSELWNSLGLRDARHRAVQPHGEPGDRTGLHGCRGGSGRFQLSCQAL